MRIKTFSRPFRALAMSAVVNALFAMTSVAQAAPVDRSSWTLSMSPTLAIPFSAGDFSANDLFASAWGGSLGAQYDIASSMPLALRVGMIYSSGGLLPAAGVAVPGSLSEATVLAGASTSLRLAPRLALTGFLDAGLTYGMLSTGTSSTYGAARAGGGVDFRLTDSLSASLDGSFLYKFGLYGGVGISLGMGYRLPLSSTTKRQLLDFSSLAIANVFPSLRSSYDKRAVGTVTIRNTGRTAATDIRVRFMVKQYMDAPKDSMTIGRLEPGASVEVPLFALFNDSILGITEATKATGEVTVEYGGLEQSRTSTVLVYDRNALTWRDDRMAAAFVSSKDPWVLDLTGNIMAAVMADRNPEVPKNFQTAIAIHEGLRAYGISYMLSPNRPFAQAVVDTATVDTLKFPRQTLGFRAGDCADLSVLYASCFEAAGIETAFVTVPGHIFMAADLGLNPTQAKAQGLALRDCIVQGERVWVPIETTLRSSGFGDAWRKAASEWRDASTAGKAAVLPIHEAWNEYAPVGLPADGSTIALPPRSDVLRAFRVELAKVVNAQLNVRIDGLGPLPSKGPGFAKASNDRGVLYAKYGMYTEAERDLKAAAREQYTPAIINLGNVAFMQSDYQTAYGYYTQAAKTNPDNPRLLVSIATVAASLGRTAEVVATLERVKKLDPKIADRYASLIQTSSSSGRAADISTGDVTWF
ncbi:MAG TPA: tetratricopeptide repeat protein [bacterium]|nr:tetratricopeptide repeat protein [bacterium]